MWTDRRHDWFMRRVENLAETPEADRVARWAGGVGLALFPLAVGVYFMITQTAWLVSGPGGVMRLDGPPAIAEGLAFVALAGLMHSHWFWCPHPKWCGAGELGKIASLPLLAGSVFYVLFWGIVCG